MRIQVIGSGVDDEGVQFLIDSLISKYGPDKVVIASPAYESDAAVAPVVVVVEPEAHGVALGGGAGDGTSSATAPPETPDPNPGAADSSAEVAKLRTELANTKTQLSATHTELAQMELNLSEQFESMKTFQQQQQQLFEQFVRLRKKYDELKRGTLKVLWEHLPSAKDDKAKHIPPCDGNLQESMSAVGSYHIGKKLGEGEFARVHDCTKMIDFEDAIDELKGEGDQSGCTTPRAATPVVNPVHPLAIKMIVKERIVALHTLARINNEIHAMAMLRTVRRGILSLHDVLHSEKYLYLVMEKGGRDLFEFLNAFPNGTSEIVAAQIISRIALAVHRCHEVGVAHRDLKPENILVKRARNSPPNAPLLQEVHSSTAGAPPTGFGSAQLDFGNGDNSGEGLSEEGGAVKTTPRSSPAEEAKQSADPPRAPDEVHVADVKLCDFGLCAVISPEAGGEEMCDFCGSPGFFAPELVMLKAYGAKQADVWSLGCVLLETLLGHERFYDLWVSA